MDHPWDRRDKESIPAYEAFNAYVLMGPGRTAQAVATECRKNVSLLARWSARWDWVERAAAWDRHQATIAYKTRTKAVVDQSKRWARRIDAYRNSLYRPFRLASKYAEKLERDARASGNDPPLALILQAIELINASKASAREAIIGFPGSEPDSSPVPRLKIPGADDRSGPEHPG